MTTRSGLRKSSTAAPCFRNSGLLTTLNGCVGLLANDLAHPLCRSGRHRALVDDDLVAVHRLADLLGHGEHMLQVGGPVLACRRADGDEHDVGPLDGVGQAGGEAQPLFGAVAPDELFEPGLVDRESCPGSAPRILAASLSTQMTALPVSAKQAPTTSPTYPVPMTAIFMRAPTSRTKLLTLARGLKKLSKFSPVRILLDYRPALRQRTGVGEYVHELARALVASPPILA